MNDFWSEERTERLIELRKLSLTFAAIAKDLGCSRSQCTGKARRIGLMGDIEEMNSRRRELRAAKRAKGWSDPRYGDPKPGIRKPPAPRPTRAKISVPDMSVRECPAPEVLGVDLLSLSLSSCRWPVGRSDGGYLFCGTEALRSKPYCAYHAWRASGRSESMVCRGAPPDWSPEPVAVEGGDACQ
jgi:hypothetical protein